MASLQELLGDRNSYPDDTKLTLAGGVETTLGEVRKGYMMESDYRRKTTTVAEQKRMLDSERQQFEAARLDAEQKLENLAASLLKREPNASRDELAEELEANPVAKALAGEIKKLNAEIAEIKRTTGEIGNEIVQSRQQAMVNEHRKVLADLKRQDPSLNEADLVAFAKANYVPRLDLAYKLLTADDKIAKAAKEAAEKARQEGIEEGKRLAVAPTLPSRARLLAPEQSKDSPQDFDSAADAALKDPEIIGLLTEGIGGS